MDALGRRTRRVAALVPLVAGLVLGTGMGLPIAHWVAGVLAHPAPLAAPSGSGAPTSPAAQPGPSSTPLPSRAALSTPSATPAPSPPTCSPLASGQQPLEPLRSPPLGYGAVAALDWVGCGSEAVPAGSVFTVGASWLVAVSYTCPSGIATQAVEPTLSVSESSPPFTSGSEVVIENRADSADVIGGAGGLGLQPGSYRLTLVTSPACLWHLAVYRG